MMKDTTGRNKKIVIVIGLLFVALVIFSMSALSENGEEVEIINKPVQVITVKEAEEPVGLEYFGTVESVQQKQLSFKMPGRLTSLFIKEGDSVTRGQSLAAIENADLQRAAEAANNNMEAAKSAYDFALDNYEKLQQLYQAGGISAQELDQARLETDSRRTAYENSKIDVNNRNAMISDTVIRADFSGIISKIFYETGEMIPAAYPVILLNSPDTKVSVGLSQRDIQTITKNTETFVTISGNQYRAIINMINLLPDPVTRTYAAELAITDDVSSLVMPIGSTVSVTFVTEQQKAIYIPLSIISRDGKDFVYVVNQENQVEKRTVELGRVKNTMVQVIGLHDGERVISEGFRDINSGDIVVIRD